MSQPSDDDITLVHQVVCDQLLDFVNRGAEPEQARFDQLTEPERQMLAMSDLEGQVFNGGFFQYYFNTAGRWSADAERGYRSLDLNSHADLIATARQIAAKETSEITPQPAQDVPPRSWAEVYHTLSNESRLRELDSPWYKLEESVSLITAKAAYIRASKDRFPHVNFVDHQDAG